MVCSGEAVLWWATLAAWFGHTWLVRMQGVGLLVSDIRVIELWLLLPCVRVSVGGSRVLREGVIWKGRVRVVVTVGCWGVVGSRGRW